ncbi:MAG: tyrosine--tRNA ligase [Candidatus Levybacteria bacterium RIFCSPLOWO2_01_FULL_38_13]|nr:MAG: tyrosine--tRNA ligase [Candidatus Levybacteria bacterium RIFCSPHIGHO2_01_FULL_41_15]OGH35270.1 MAG: tyrosine--tRNA ligase [Candidatus Levybacteria bacterium RIFCSPLOWO2_01_FULL_38_13]
MDKIGELLTRGVANIIPSKEELEKLLRSGKKLNVYLGIDPTATKIHLGHAVSLRKLQQFADLGHNVTFLIGDFTALIGDTSDKDSERPVLTSTQIEDNFKTYKKQAEKFLDFSKIKVRYNSEWLDKITSRDFIKLAQQFSFGDFGSRELIKKRLQSGRRVGLHEGLYPAMQGYDSYFMDTDIQIGGTDQTFNMQAGRILQKSWRNKESFILANEFLAGTDGRKMSKTWNNTIWLEDKPFDMYAKVMAINDDFIIQYFLLATNLPASKIGDNENELKNKLNPINVKRGLARQIVKELHGEKEAEQAENNFEKTVQKKEAPKDLNVFVLEKVMAIDDVLVLTGLAGSKSKARRLVEQGGVSVDGEIIRNANEKIKTGIIKVGKHRFIKIKIKKN